MRTALIGRKLVRFDAPELVGTPPRAGRTIEHVRSHGKDVNIVFDDSLVLHTHLRMSSAWHLYHRGERWRRSYRQMRAAIETDEWLAVCFSAPVVETYLIPDRRRHPGMGLLGPDISRSDTDLAHCVDLVLSHPDPDAAIAEVLLDQRVISGVGNVYRSEVLWACALHPWAPVGSLSHTDVTNVVSMAARLLRANLEHAERITTPGVDDGLAVYGRTMQRCVRCAGSIETSRRGDFTRIVYWCPGCQVRYSPDQSAGQREMDPHPAATKYLRDLPWRKHPGYRSAPI